MRTDGSADIDGLTLVGDVNTQFGLHIDEETYNTVGGYVLGRLGRRARVGDTIRRRGAAHARRTTRRPPGRAGVVVETGQEPGADGANHEGHEGH